MSTMKKRIPMFLLALAMMVAMALPTFALSNKTSTMPSNHDAEECVSDIVAANSDDTGTVTPYAAAHCEKNGNVGYYIRTNFSSVPVGKEFRNCTDGRVGISDYRVQYHRSETYRCNLCKSEYTTSDYYWGNWVCP